MRDICAKHLAGTFLLLHLLVNYFFLDQVWEVFIDMLEFQCQVLMLKL